MTALHKSEEMGVRPREIEGFSNRYLIHPSSRRLVPILARHGIHPNAVSATGFLCGLTGALFLYQASGPADYLAAFLGLLGWFILDGADGELARATGQTSASGRVIDGVADYSVFVVLYITLWLAAPEDQRALYWWLGWAAGASHILQSTAYELARERYCNWVRGGPLPLQSAGSASHGLPFPLSAFAGAFAALQRLMRGQEIAAPGIQVDADQVIGLYRKRFAPLVKHWGILSANSHVVALFLFALAGRPTDYFLFEVVIFNLALAVLFLLRRRATRDLANDFAALASPSDDTPVSNS